MQIINNYHNIPVKKALECTTSGTTAIQSGQSYGTWEFEYYTDVSDRSRIDLIAMDINSTV